MPANRLALVERNTERASIRVGARVQLRSGGPDCLALAVDGDAVTVGWEDSDGAQEWVFSLPCLRLLT